MFRQKVVYKFTSKILRSNGSTNLNKTKDKLVEIMKLPPFISVRLPKKVLEKIKILQKRKQTSGNSQAKILCLDNKSEGLQYFENKESLSKYSGK